MENQDQCQPEKAELMAQKSLWMMVVAKGWANEDYKRELLKNTNEVLIKEGIKIPTGMTVHIVDVKQPSTPSDIYFVWPNPSTTFLVEKSEIRKAASSTTGGQSTSGS